MNSAALVLAAGRGDRLGAAEPKAFIEVAGHPLLTWAARTVEGAPEIGALFVAAPAGWEARAEKAASSSKLAAVVTGGETRQASVRTALARIPDDWDAVVCHDVARPLARGDLFARVLGALHGADGAVPVIPVTDTVKRLKDREILETVPRDELALAQTPQAFRRAALVAAHREAEIAGVTATDDATLLERAGYRVEAVPGDPENLKITSPRDLAVAEALLRADG
jgi:2-C-methyl-D-erythritol 4-phosphate cytidylyltransferase